ncbi:MAG: 3-oxoacyl-ACP reductase FabG, partial [Moraxella sp.]|nr:3-oxoacyl-ACP reductase FabG [Moraxella sp.]
VNDYLQELGGAGRVLNVQDTEQTNQLFDSIEKEFGNVQVLVNNAGITQDGLLMRMDDNAWERVLDVNLTSVFRTSKRAMKGMMKARQGRIINITSVVAAMGNAGQTNYTASKAGIEGFTRSLAREIGSRQITVNCVAPGFIDTDMTKDLDEALIQSMLNAVPLARLGKPEDIAAAVNFLASEEAGYITGTVLDVNGGMYM